MSVVSDKPMTMLKLKIRSSFGLSWKAESVLQQKEQRNKEKSNRNRCIKNAQMFLTRRAQVKSEILFQNLEKITFPMTRGMTFNS